MVDIPADPSDEEKLAISRETNIGIAQISHWYGDKYCFLIPNFVSIRHDTN